MATVIEGGNKSNHPIQNPLLFVMEPQTHDILVSEVIMTRDSTFNHRWISQL
jgi:hypothetical protein